jgi:hypothetical protein
MTPLFLFPWSSSDSPSFSSVVASPWPSIRKSFGGPGGDLFSSLPLSFLPTAHWAWPLSTFPVLTSLQFAPFGLQQITTTTYCLLAEYIIATSYGLPIDHIKYIPHLPVFYSHAPFGINYEVQPSKPCI